MNKPWAKRHAERRKKEFAYKESLERAWEENHKKRIGIRASDFSDDVTRRFYLIDHGCPNKGKQIIGKKIRKKFRRIRKNPELEYNYKSEKYSYRSACMILW